MAAFFFVLTEGGERVGGKAGGLTRLFFRQASKKKERRMPTTPHAAALLAALAYPHPDASLGDAAALQDLVAWLEHTKVRKREQSREKTGGRTTIGAAANLA